jgi:hypothetical protein
MSERNSLIPISSAKALGQKHEKDQVIIATWCMKDGTTTITTWGNSIHDADQAAIGGNLIKEALGWPEENCKDVSARVNVLLDALSLARYELSMMDKKESEAFKAVCSALDTVVI